MANYNGKLSPQGYCKCIVDLRVVGEISFFHEKKDSVFRILYSFVTWQCWERKAAARRSSDVLLCSQTFLGIAWVEKT